MTPASVDWTLTAGCLLRDNVFTLSDQHQRHGDEKTKGRADELRMFLFSLICSCEDLRLTCQVRNDDNIKRLRSSWLRMLWPILEWQRETDPHKMLGNICLYTLSSLAPEGVKFSPWVSRDDGRSAHCQPWICLPPAGPLMLLLCVIIW